MDWIFGRKRNWRIGLNFNILAYRLNQPIHGNIHDPFYWIPTVYSGYVEIFRLVEFREYND